MASDIWLRLLLGHLFGDYLLQGQFLALNKTRSGISGIKWCTLHSLIYTVCVAFFLWTLNPLVIFLIFISHWPIDRWSLGEKWLKLIGGRDFKEVYRQKGDYWEIFLSFGTIVYTVVDNTLHIFLMWLIVKYLLV